MESRVRTSPEQLLTLLEFMETHGDLSRPRAGPQGRVRSDQLWTDLTNTLNSVGGGVSKTTEKWKKVWADWKSKTKKKGLLIRQHQGGTGGGPASGQTLSQTEERLLAIMGGVSAMEGQASIEELGFYRPQSPAVDLVSQDEDSEVVDGDPQPTSPLYRWLLPSTSQESTSLAHSLVLNRPSDEGGQPAAPPPPSPPPAPAAEAPPPAPAAEAPLPAAPAAPTTPRRRRLLAPRAPATSPPDRRRQRVRSPATPHSAASADRPRLRGRRARTMTPFERAASEFASVELRRVQTEETRIRLRYETEMRRIEVENDRNQFFRSILNMAQIWLDHYISRDNRNAEH